MKTMLHMRTVVGSIGGWVVLLFGVAGVAQGLDVQENQANNLRSAVPPATASAPMSAPSPVLASPRMMPPTSRPSTRPLFLPRHPSTRPHPIPPPPIPPAPTSVPTIPVAPVVPPLPAVQPTSGAVKTQPVTLPATSTAPAASAEPPTPSLPVEPYVAPTTRPATTQPQAALVRPNIILITTSELGAGMTGFEGNTQVKTPSLDALASESARLTRFYVPTPQDCPSRGTLLSGLYPHSHGATHENTSLIRGTVTFTGQMKKADYACAVVGYWPLSPQEGEADFGLTDYVAISAKTWTWNNCDVFVQGQPAKADKHLTEWVADRAVEFLAKPHEKPFFLWVSFHAPHQPLEYPPGTQELYPPDQLTVPEVVQTPVPGRPRQLDSQKAVTEYRRATPDSLRKERSQYFAMLSRVDENIGQVLKQIDRQNLRGNTVVIFTSTYGCSLGEHQILGTGPFFYDGLIRVPLLVRTPQYDLAGQKIDRVVSGAGFAPTMCELAGVPMIAVHGESFLPLLKDPASPQHMDEAFLEYNRTESVEFPVRGVITPQYKFIKYLNATEVLFDLRQEPSEATNLVESESKEYAPVCKVFSERLKTWQRQTDDPKRIR